MKKQYQYPCYMEYKFNTLNLICYFIDSKNIFCIEDNSVDDDYWEGLWKKCTEKDMKHFSLITDPEKIKHLERKRKLLQLTQ